MTKTEKERALKAFINEQKPKRDCDIYIKFIKDLEKIKKGLLDTKKKLD